MDEWIREKEYTTTEAKIPAMEDFHMLSYATMCDRIERICKSWYFGTEDETMKTLEFFMRNASSLFTERFIRFKKELGLTDFAIDSLDARCAKLDAVVTSALRALEALVNEDNMKLSEIGSSEVLQIQRSLRGNTKDLVLAELGAIRDFFNLGVSNDSALESARAAGERAQAASEVLRLLGEESESTKDFGFGVSPLRDVKEFLCNSNPNYLEPHSVDELEAIYSQASHPDLTLKEVVDVRRRINDFFCGMQFHHLYTLGTLKHAQELLMFFRKEDDLEVSIRMQESILDINDAQLLQSLSLTFKFVNEVFPNCFVPAGAGRPSTPTLRIDDIAQTMIHQMPSTKDEKTCEILVQNIGTSIRNFERIGTFFAGALDGMGAATVHVDRFESLNGRFWAKTPNASGGSCLYLAGGGDEGTPDHFISKEEQLRELQRSAIFLCEGDVADAPPAAAGVVAGDGGRRGDGERQNYGPNDGDDSEQNQLDPRKKLQLQNFIQSYEIAQEIVVLLAEAESIGMPDFQAQGK